MPGDNAVLIGGDTGKNAPGDFMFAADARCAFAAIAAATAAAVL